MTGDTTDSPDPADAALIQQFQAAMATVPQLGGARLVDLLRHVPDKRAIFRGMFNGQDAVLRFYIENAQAYSKRDWDELVRVAPFMAAGQNRVNLPLFHWPGLGLVITTFEQGQPMLQRIWQSDKPDRLQYMGPAAVWLRAYAAPSETSRPIRAGNWVKKAERRATQQAFPRLRPLVAEVLQELNRIAPLLDGQFWRFAICHGDFHPNNLLVHDNGLTGIDLGGSNRMPIYKDIARFLVHMGRRGLLPSGRAHMGVDAASFSLFADAFEMSPIERDLALPFMVGVDAMFRMETSGLSRSRVRRAQAFYELLCDDIRKVGR